MDISRGVRGQFSGHFSEEDCFPAKGPKDNLVKFQLANATLKENRPGPIPDDDLNIKPRNEAKLKATTPCVAFPTVTDEFNDLRKKATPSGICGVQEENFGNCEIYKSNTSQPSSPMSVDMTDNSSTMEYTLSQKSPPGDQCPRQGMQPVGDKVQQDEFPSTSQPSSPMSVDITDNSLTMEYTPSPISPPVDQRPRQGTQPAGGKDIKNHLRKKLLRRQSTDPYRMDTDRTKLTSTKSKVTGEISLLAFAALLDDSE